MNEKILMPLLFFFLGILLVTIYEYPIYKFQDATDYIEFENITVKDYHMGIFILEFNREIKKTIDDVDIARRIYVIESADPNPTLIDSQYFRERSIFISNEPINVEVPFTVTRPGFYYFRFEYTINLPYGIKKPYVVTSNVFHLTNESFKYSPEQN